MRVFMSVRDEVIKERELFFTSKLAIEVYIFFTCLRLSDVLWGSAAVTFNAQGQTK